MTKSLSLRFQGRIWTWVRKKEKYGHQEGNVFFYIYLAVLEAWLHGGQVSEKTQQLQDVLTSWYPDDGS